MNQLPTPEDHALLHLSLTAARKEIKQLQKFLRRERQRKNRIREDMHKRIKTLEVDLSTSRERNSVLERRVAACREILHRFRIGAENALDHAKRELAHMTEI